MDRSLEGMRNAGLLFVFSVWLQGQMSDLTIFKSNPDLVADFVASSDRVPQAFAALRSSYWEKQFGEVKNEFYQAFSAELNRQEVKEIDEIFHVRNMIGHAHISLGRDYMLYRPAGDKKERAVIEALNPQQIEDQADPVMLVLEFWRPEIFKNLSDKIGRIDQGCFSRLAGQVGVPHGRIR